MTGEQELIRRRNILMRHGSENVKNPDPERTDTAGVYAVSVQNLHAGYGSREILHDLSFQIACGSSTVILGANGCGKTTLLRALNGSLSSTGRIQILGQDLAKMKRKEIACAMSMMSQISSVYFSYSIRETVELGRYARSRRTGLSSHDRDMVDQAIEMTGLGDIQDRQISQLSGGQLQRVFLARTLAQETPIILLDEPTNHLDFRYQAELMDFLKSWLKKKTSMPDGTEVNNTLIGVFHDLSLAAGIATDMIFLKDGKLLKQGHKGEVLTPSILSETYDIDAASYMKETWGNFLQELGDPDR